MNRIMLAFPYFTIHSSLLPPSTAVTTEMASALYWSMLGKKTTRVWLTCQVYLGRDSYVFSPLLSLFVLRIQWFSKTTTNLLFINLAFIFIFNGQSIVEWLRWSWPSLLFLLSFPDEFSYIFSTIYLCVVNNCLDI